MKIPVRKVCNERKEKKGEGKERSSAEDNHDFFC